MSRTSKDETQRAFASAFDLRDAGRIDEAVAAFRHALSAHPDFAKGWWVLGGLHFEQSEYGEAVNCFQRAVTLKPRNEDCSQGLFHALLSAGRVNDAIAEARRFLGELRAGAKACADVRALYESYDKDGSALADEWRGSRN